MGSIVSEIDADFPLYRPLQHNAKICDGAAIGHPILVGFVCRCSVVVAVPGTDLKTSRNSVAEAGRFIKMC